MIGLRGKNVLQKAIDDLIAAYARGLGGECGEDAMAEDGVGYRRDVLGGDVNPAV